MFQFVVSLISETSASSLVCYFSLISTIKLFLTGSGQISAENFRSGLAPYAIT